jgi:[acyl-carrier-protein] S-malonyltransferase
LAAVLADVTIDEMLLPVISNVEATPNQDASQVSALLVRQVSAPVRWQETMECMVNLGIERYIEIGPGKVLSGLIKRMAKGSTIQNVQNMSDISALAG